MAPKLPGIECVGCPLQDAGAPRVLPKTRRAEILAIGEAPGAEEAERGVPFIGPAGRMLREALDGLDVVYANTVQCRPPENRQPTKDEIKACTPTVERMIDEVRPRIILAVGAVALKALVNKTGILKYAGKTFVREDGHIIMALIHPAWVLRGGDARKFDDAIKMLRVWLNPAKVRYSTIKAGSALSCVSWKPGPLGFDWETNQLRPTEEGKLLSRALSDGEVTIFQAGEPDESVASFLSSRRLVAHSATFEHEWAKSRGINAYITDDTQILSHLVDERLSTKLENVAVRLGVPMITYEDSNVKDYPLQKLAERNSIHAQATRQIYDILIKRISPAENRLYRQVLVPATETLADIHLAGVKYDDGVRKRALADIAKNSVSPMKLLCHTAGTPEFNIKSAPQRVRLLYEVLKLPKIFTTEGGAWSTDAEVLRYFQRRYKNDKNRGPVLDALLELTAMAGWRTQFLEAFPKYAGPDHILRGRYHVTGTVNGRLSTSEPNMQNMPRHGPVRSCLVSRFGDEGRLWTADYKQIELVVFAAISRDSRMIKAFQEGQDIHRLTGSIVLHKQLDEITDDERFLAKRLNFAMATGVGAAKFAFMVGISEEEAKTYINRFFDGYQGLWDYVNRYRHNVPPTITSPTGRTRHLDLSDPIRARNQALNFIPAEVALTVHLMAANKTARFIRQENLRSRLACLVHDSLTPDVRLDEEDVLIPAFIDALNSPNDSPILEKILATGVRFNVDIKYGPSMGEQEEYEI